MVKQMVIINMAVPMDFSQMSVQAAHASMLGILNQGYWHSDPQDSSIMGHGENIFSVECEYKPELETWLKDHFTLVLCKIWGKKALLDIKAEAEALGLNTAVMEDYGHTTALAIGPAEEDKLLPFKRLTLL